MSEVENNAGLSLIWGEMTDSPPLLISATE